MPKPPKHKENLIDSAVRLFRRQGYTGTGLQQILTLSGAPKGSLYHYFPLGKEAIGRAAVERAGELVAATLAQLAADCASPEDFVAAYFARYADWMEESDFQSGCPIATTLLETAPRSESITAAGLDAIEGWVRIMAEVFARAGVGPQDAAEDARFTIAALEGALVLARVTRSRDTIETVGRRVSRAIALP